MLGLNITSIFDFENCVTLLNKDTSWHSKWLSKRMNFLGCRFKMHLCPEKRWLAHRCSDSSERRPLETVSLSASELRKRKNRIHLFNSQVSAHCDETAAQLETLLQPQAPMTSSSLPASDHTGSPPDGNQRVVRPEERRRHFRFKRVPFFSFVQKKVLISQEREMRWLNYDATFKNKMILCALLSL